MVTLIKSIFLNNKTIKVFSFIIGYGLWSFLGQIYQISHTITVPICLYNVPQDSLLEAQPQTITVTLAGKRQELRQCTDIGLHVNAALLKPGQNLIMPDEEQLFLPKTVKLLHCKPLKVSITRESKDSPCS